MENLHNFSASILTWWNHCNMLFGCSRNISYYIIINVEKCFL